MNIVMFLSRGVCVATLPSEVAADRSVGFVRSWLFITLNSEQNAHTPVSTYMISLPPRQTRTPLVKTPTHITQQTHRCNVSGEQPAQPHGARAAQYYHMRCHTAAGQPPGTALLLHAAAHL